MQYKLFYFSHMASFFLIKVPFIFNFLIIWPIKIRIKKNKYFAGVYGSVDVSENSKKNLPSQSADRIPATKGVGVLQLCTPTP